MNQPSSSPNVLVAPLDWGLGHATRCVPVIRELLQQGCAVTIAASGRGSTLLQHEFPDLPVLSLRGYAIRYAATSWGLALTIVAQIPKLLLAVKKEHTWLQKVVADKRFDAVISDNRFGLHHPGIHSVFITHQLCIQTPRGVGQKFLQRLNYSYINRFDECWVPDAESENNLSGQLSHPIRRPTVPLYYTGPLSRFGNVGRAAKKNDLLILLSGPEPQRTMLEKKLLAELQTSDLPFVLVRGLPGQTGSPLEVANGTIYPHLPATQLQQAIAGASLVVARCGYSTIMDLAAMQKRSILIPTPGQTEQEYLAKHLMQKNFALCLTQKNFRLKTALALAENFPYQLNQTPAENRLTAVVAAFVNKIRWEKGQSQKKSMAQ